jgi:UDP-N-acetyl-D-mannosaminuronate dehydrogenase
MDGTEGMAKRVAAQAAGADSAAWASWAERYADSAGTVAVVGLGKIGLPLALQYAQRERRVIGCDVDTSVVASLNAGVSHLHEEPGIEDAVARAIADERFAATADTAQAVRQAQVVVVIVPVAIDAAHRVDFASIEAATRSVGAGLQPGSLVIYESTVPVGTTNGRLRPLLEAASGLTAGDDFLLAFSPERVLSGRVARDLADYPKVVGGIDAQSTEAAAAFYGSVLGAPVMRMGSAADAEFVKLIETTYRDVNIALANEFARFADARGLDVTAAIAAANTQPYSHLHQPGVGVGGHCIPVYPYFLLGAAQEPSQSHNGTANVTYAVPSLEATGMVGTADELTLPRRARVINDGMAAYAVERIEAVTGPLAGRSALILGVAYRGDVKETAFSSARLVQQALVARGATVYADDPLFAAEELVALGYTPYRPEAHAHAIEVIVVQAAHAAYQALDFAQFPVCRVVLDGRRAIAPERVEHLGMRYLRIGGGRIAASEL